MIIEGKERTSVGADALMSAQMIADAFARAIQEQNCSSVIPMAAYVEADQHESLISDLANSISSTYSGTISTDSLEKKIEQSEEDSEKQDKSLSKEIIDKAKEECVDCGVDFDFDEQIGKVWKVFEDLIGDAQDFIDSIKRLWDDSIPNYCHLANMLSNLCLPDLVSILSMILAFILKLLASIFLGTFAVLSFVMGIVTAILGSIISFITAMLSFAVKPITCLIESIASALDLIPTENSVKTKLTEDQLKLLGMEKDTSLDNNDLAKQYSEKLRETYRDTPLDKTKSMFESSKSQFEKASKGVSDTVDEMLGIKDYLMCEPKRNGSSVFDVIGDAMEMFQLANLIKSVIEQKTLNIAVDELCKDEGKDNSTIKGNVGNFSQETIAEVIANTFDGTARIVESEDQDIAILIKKSDQAPRGDRLSLNTCSVNSFIEESHMDRVVEASVDRAKEYLFGEGEDPRSSRVERVSINDLEIQDNEKVLLFGSSDNLDKSVIEIVDEIFSLKNYNRSVNLRQDVYGQTQSLVNGIVAPRDASEEILSAPDRTKSAYLERVSESVTNPLGISIMSERQVAEMVSESKGGTSDYEGMIDYRDLTDELVSLDNSGPISSGSSENSGGTLKINNEIFSGRIQLKCNSVEDIFKKVMEE